MAFDSRSDSTTASYAWADTEMQMTIRSLTTVAGGSADPPVGAVRGSRWECDTSVDVSVRGRLRFVLPTSLVAPPTPGDDDDLPLSAFTKYVAEVEWPAPKYYERRHAFLHVVDKKDDEWGVFRTLVRDVRSLGHPIPYSARGFIREAYAAFLRRAAEKALFLGHTAMRVTVEVDVLVVEPYNERNDLHRRLVGLIRSPPCGQTSVPPAVAAGLGFDIAAPARYRAPSQVCAVCLEDVAGAWKVGVTPCGHVYHIKCIRRWQVESSQCPLCRTTVRDSDVRLSMAFLCPNPVPLSVRFSLSIERSS